MSFNKISISTLIIVLSILALSCSQQKHRWQGTIEEVDGVTVVKNPKEPIAASSAQSVASAGGLKPLSVRLVQAEWV